MAEQRLFTIAVLLFGVSLFYVGSYAFRRPDRQPEFLWLAVISVLFGVFLLTQTAWFRALASDPNVPVQLANACLYLSVIAIYLLIGFLFYNRLDRHGLFIIVLACMLFVANLLGPTPLQEAALLIFQAGAFYTTAYCAYLFYLEFRQRSWFKFWLGAGILVLCVGGIVDILTLHRVIALPRAIDLSVAAFVALAATTSEVKNRVQARGLVPGARVSPAAFASLQLNVVVVDDNHTQLGVLEALLQDRVGRLTLYASPEQALQTMPPDTDLVITDYHMEAMDGSRLTRALLRRHPSLRIIGLTGDPSGGIAESLLAAGAVRVLVKPVLLRALEGEIWRVMRGR